MGGWSLQRLTMADERTDLPINPPSTSVKGSQNPANGQRDEGINHSIQLSPEPPITTVINVVSVVF